MAKRYNLAWQTFMSHGKDLFKDLYETNRFSDVTLVSDDQYQYKVHRFVLGACSTVFKSIFENNPQNTSIYLRGIGHEELKSVLEFIYMGKAMISQERLNEFINVAKDLKIKEIGDSVVLSDNIEDSNEAQINVNVKQENYTLACDELMVNIKQEKGIQVMNENIRPVVIYKDDKYLCNSCEKMLSSKFEMSQHIKANHKDVKYICQQCNYQGTQFIELQQHVRSKHIKYPCQICDYEGESRSSFITHINKNHPTKYICKKK